MSSFPARYSGLCIPCGEDIKPGESIINHSDAGYIHEECAENVGKVAQTHDAREAAVHRTRPVMPTGKTAKDRCNKCFIIHTAGQDGCE